MKVIFNLEQVEALAVLKEYANKKGTEVDKIIDQAITKIALNVKTLEEKNECSEEEIYRARLDQYTINDFVKEKLKFKYFLLKDGTVACAQYNKLKKLNYSYDSGSAEAYVYLLLNGCPNKADIPTLQRFSLRLSMKEIYEKIYGKNTYEKYVEKNIMKKIEASQAAWKAKNNGGK